MGKINNSEVAYNFRYNMHNSDRAENFWIRWHNDGRTLYSYSTPIARKDFETDAPFIISEKKYSVTTMKQKSYLMRLLVTGDYIEIYDITQSPENNIKYKLDDIANSIKKAKRARKWKQSHLNDARRHIMYLIMYLDYIKADKRGSLYKQTLKAINGYKTAINEFKGGD